MPGISVRTVGAVPRLLTALLALAAVSSTPLHAQNYRLDLPWDSPRGFVSQVVGLTTLSVDYGRPGAGGRFIWGGLVPWDTVWRAGANVNTVFASTSPFTFGGTTLPAGRYGVFMIPGRNEWTVILSHQANAWGAFSYMPTEDAVRVTVTAKSAEMVERLQYSLDDPTSKSVTFTMKWERLSVSVPVEINRDVVVLDSLRSQLRGLPRFWGAAWEQAAGWALNNTSNLDLAEIWADTAVALTPNFATFNLKARVLDRRGMTAQADSLRKAHLATASEAELNAYGYLLLNQKRNSEAIAIFVRNTKEHPDSWNTWDSLGEAYAATGDKAKAVTNYQKAFSLTTDPTQKKRIEGILAGLK